MDFFILKICFSLVAGKTNKKIVQGELISPSKATKKRKRKKILSPTKICSFGI